MAKKWFLIGDGRQFGPFTLEQLDKLAASGRLRPESQVRQEGTAPVKPAASIDELFQEPAPPSPSPQNDSEALDPYARWLGISAEARPPTHYQLLGIAPFEDNTKIIEQAVVHRRKLLVQKKKEGHAELAEQLLKDVAAARECLLDSRRKYAYDLWLQAKLDSTNTSDAPMFAAATVVAPPKTIERRKGKGAIRQLIEIVGGGIGGLLLAVLILWYGFGNDITGFFAAKPKPVAAKIHAPPQPEPLQLQPIPSPEPQPEVEPVDPMPAIDPPSPDPQPTPPKQVDPAPTSDDPLPEPSVAQIVPPADPPPASTPKPAAKPARIAFNDHAYTYIAEPMSWHDAKKHCEQLGGHLAIVETAEESEFLLKVAKNCLPEFWVGATDEVKEGDWRWVDGTKVDAKAIGLRTDNYLGGEDWLAYWRPFLNWNDHGAAEFRFICEWDSVEEGDLPVSPADPKERFASQPFTIRPPENAVWTYREADATWTACGTQSTAHSLVSTAAYDDFELRCDIRVEASAAASIGFRGDGIANGMALLFGICWSRPSDIAKPARGMPPYYWFIRQQHWNAVRIRAEGPSVRCYVNDILISDLAENVSRKGPIMLHASAGDFSVSYRNIQVRRLEADVSKPALPKPATPPLVQAPLSRSLWSHRDGYFIEVKTGEWHEFTYAGKKFVFRETTRDSEHIHLRDDSRKLAVRLSADFMHLCIDPAKDFGNASYTGSWVRHFDELPGLCPNLVGEAEAYERELSDARDTLLLKLNMEIAQARAKGRGADERRIYESLERDRASFQNAGLIPWSYAMRPATLDYLKCVKTARERLNAAIATEIETHRAAGGGLAPTLQAYRYSLLEPSIIMELDCQTVGSTNRFYYAFLIDGTADDQHHNKTLTWTLDRNLLTLTGIPGGGNGIVDRYTFDELGATIHLTNNLGAQATGTVVKAPDAGLSYRLDGQWSCGYSDGVKTQRTIEGVRVRDSDGSLCRILPNGREFQVSWPNGWTETLRIDPKQPNLLTGVNKAGTKSTWARIK